ncbi:MAG: fumarylacetoacetase, partial [Pseudomonadota bacterium]
LTSWVDSANSAETDFPLNNLPYGRFSTAGEAPRLGVAIGDQVLDVAKTAEALPVSTDILHDPRGWNGLMEAGPEAWKALRTALTQLLSSDAAPRQGALVSQEACTLHLPFTVAEFTDFYASRHHATNVGTMFRGAENALPPNWLHIPIGYNGRASSVVVSGTDIRRPWGQLKGPEDSAPRFAPSARFDIELELGAIVGQPSNGPLTVTEADANIFGYVLLNDWSARDLQAWEYQPLGPFQAKATATTISPWIVTAAALEPFRVPTPTRAVPLLPHLQEPGPMLYDISLTVDLNGETIAHTNYAEMYYAAAQQLAHHTTSGCPMRVGDLLGSGTISGPERGNCGSLLEITWGGKDPLEMPGGATRTFLEDGDTVVLRGGALAEDHRIGFGVCAGTLLPALENPYSRGDTQ